MGAATEEAKSACLFAAARSCLALTWKIVLVVELIGRSSGVGFEIELNFQNFEIGMIFVYALAFMAVIQTVVLEVRGELAALGRAPARLGRGDLDVVGRSRNVPA